MSKFSNLKFVILIWCVFLLTKSVYLSTIPIADQNVYQNDEDTTNRLKNILLRRLDFEDEPSKLGDTSLPNYLLELFETNSLYQNNRIFQLNNSNTIRSHPIIDSSEQFEQSTKKSNKTGFIVKFNLTSSNSDKEILNAGEFRLYLNNTINLCASNKQRISINQIINQQLVDQSVNKYIDDKDEDNLIFRQIDTMIVEQGREPRWLQFDVLSAVESWMQRSSTNHGLLIRSSCVQANNLNLDDRKFVDGLIFQPLDQRENLNPVLLTYTNLQNMDYEADSLDLINKKKRHVNQEFPLTPAQNKNEKSEWKTSKTKDCARYSMYVDFAQIGWSDWIVAPRGYDAYLCYGECSLSVIRNGNTTNHATMQSLSNGIQPDIVPPPCCVPTEFSPLSLIYLEGTTSVLKIYEDMIVTKCGCR